eukprot:2946957-Lingulodinium_polyedra.AAC.1
MTRARPYHGTRMAISRRPHGRSRTDFLQRLRGRRHNERAARPQTPRRWAGPGRRRLTSDKP